MSKSFNQLPTSNESSEMDLAFMREHGKFIANDAAPLDKKNFSSRDKAITAHEIAGALFLDKLAVQRGY